MLAACAPPSSADETVRESRVAVESCIDANLDHVEMAFENLYFGSEYLLSKICAAELGAAVEVYHIENNARRDAATTKKCGPIVEIEDDRLKSYPDEVDFDQSLANAKVRRDRDRILDCHRGRTNFGMPERPLPYEALESIHVVMTVYASKRLLNLRISRLDGESTGDK